MRRIDIRHCYTIDDVNRELQKIELLFKKIPIFIGEGNPENEIAANIGTLFINEEGGATTTLYVKETGEGTKSGWVAK